MHFERGPVKIFYEVDGDASAPCVTLLNGYSRTSTDFRAMSKMLVEQGWRVLRLDNRGAGKTENPPGFTVSDMVQDVVSLWDALKVSQSHLLGISYGGVLSILATNQHPTRVKSLILVSTTPSSFFLGIDNDLSSQEPKDVEANLSRYFSERFRNTNAILFQSLLKETARAFHDPNLRERTAQQRAALKKFDFTALLHAIRCPTLVLHGEDDNVATPEAADVMHRAIKHSELVTIPSVGHLLLAESPKLFYEKVSDFLARHR